MFSHGFSMFFFVFFQIGFDGSLMIFEWLLVVFHSFCGF